MSKKKGEKMTIYMLKNGEYRMYDLSDIDLKYIGWDRVEGEEVCYWVTRDSKLAVITSEITKAQIKILG